MFALLGPWTGGDKMRIFNTYLVASLLLSLIEVFQILFTMAETLQLIELVIWTVGYEIVHKIDSFGSLQLLKVIVNSTVCRSQLIRP